jgi:hypothetical protein
LEHAGTFRTNGPPRASHATSGSSASPGFTASFLKSGVGVGPLKSPPRRAPFRVPGAARPAQRPPTGLPARPVRRRLCRRADAVTPARSSGIVQRHGGSRVHYAHLPLLAGRKRSGGQRRRKRTITATIWMRGCRGLRGRVVNEIERARISMMARSSKAPSTDPMKVARQDRLPAIPNWRIF